MKTLRKHLSGLIIVGGFIALAGSIQAQVATTQNSAAPLAAVPPSGIDWNSASDLTVMLQAVESTQPVAAESAPMANAYYSAQNPAWPPLPCNINNVPVWSLGNGTVLLDDLDVDYSQQPLNSSMMAGRMHAMGVPVPGDGSGDGGTDGSFTSNYVIPNYGTNLWMALTNLSNGTAGLLVSNTMADVKYEIRGVGDLLATQWLSEGFFLGSELTNWTAASAAATNHPNLFLRIRSWIDSDNVGIPDWWQLQYFGYVGINPYAASPAGDGFDIFSKYQSGVAPTTFVTPSAPSNFVAVLSTNGADVLLSWNAAQGAVTGYTIQRGVFDWNTYNYDYSQIGTVNSNTTAFTDVGGIAAGGGIDPVYELTDIYPGGNSSQTAFSDLYYSPPPPPTPPTPIYNIYLGATLVRNATGRWQVMFSGFPTNNAQTIRLSWTDPNWHQDANFSTNSQTVSTSTLTNGVYQIPDAEMVTLMGSTNTSLSVQLFGPNGEHGQVVPVGILSDDAPYFVDGRQHLKQNLIFLLRAATLYYPYMVDPYDEYGTDYQFNTSTNFEEFSFLHQGFDYRGNTWIALDDLWPFNVNYELRNDLLDTNNPGPFQFTWSINFDPNPAHPVLSHAEPYWILQGSFSNRLADLGVTLFINYGLDGMPTNFMNLQAGSYDNCYGLSVEAGRGVNASVGIDPTTGLPTGFPLNYQTVNPGSSVYWVEAPIANYYSQFQSPTLQPINYYFVPLVNSNENLMNLPSVNQQPFPLPIDDTFKVTNQTPPLIIGAVGQPVIIGGWAKYGIQGSNPAKYAYLGQYFVTNAFLLNTNGAVTTNSAGILSPYGEFFPTQAGKAALVTMPDIDAPYEQGTCTVSIVSLNVDANHDGTMDLSYFGQDQTSPSKSYVFWCNNNFDREHSVDGSDFEQDDLESGGDVYQPNAIVPDCNYSDISGNRIIPDTRDLEDFSRLWINGVTSNLLATLPSGSTVTLSWGDIGSPNPANPTVDLFQAADSDGGMGYLTNSTIAANQINPALCGYVGRIKPGQGVQLNAGLFGSTWQGNHFIWCGVANGNGKLNLTFADASGRTLGQASVYIQIVDIKQMYERWTVGDNTAQPPAATAYPAGDLPADMTQSFQYPTLATTNTPYILFVHGWNMPLWEKDRYAETAFKRLWWQGYQGRFGEFRWPTYYNFLVADFQWQSYDLNNFDNSELNAWNSGAGLLNLLTSLNTQYPGQVYLTAHSMGNIVAGEALRLAGASRVVNTYVAMQGAVSAHAYDPSTANRTIPSYPDDYGQYWTNGAPCYFNGIAGAGTYVNFFNTNDWALANPLVWPLDQTLKPHLGYSYNSAFNYWSHLLSQLSYTTADRYTIFAYCDPSWSYALGAQAGMGGKFSGNQVELDVSPYNFNIQHKYHSGEFRSDNPQRWQFWNQVLVQIKLK